MNQVNLIGNVGSDPEVRSLENGTAVAKFSLATNESYRDRDGNRQTKTEWHKIICWGKLAEVAETYFKKGTKLRITGKIKTRSWEDKNGGADRYITEIHTTEFSFVGSARDSSNDFPTEAPPAATPKAAADVQPESGEDADDLPF